VRRRSSTEKRDVKGLQSFYESQNAHIQRMLKSVDEHRREAKDSAEDTRLRFLIAVHGSLAANLILDDLFATLTDVTPTIPSPAAQYLTPTATPEPTAEATP